MLAWLESASIDCARLIRGIDSIAKLVAPDSAIVLIPSALVSGCRNPISVVADDSRASSSELGGATLTTTSEDHTSAASSVTLAPASSYWESGSRAPDPAP